MDNFNLRKLSAQSRKQYTYMLNKLRKEGGLESDEQLKKFLGKKKTVTQRNYLSMLCVYYDEIGKNTDSLKKRLLLKQTEFMKSTEDQKAMETNTPQITWRQIKAKIPVPIIDEWKVWRDFCVSAVFVLMPPRRNKDFVCMKLKDDGVNNFYDMDAKTFLFRKFKTVQYFGEQTIKVPTILHDHLVKYISLRGPESDYLFVNNKIQPTTSDWISKKLCVQLGFSSTQLRRIFVTYWMRKPRSMKNKALLAEFMGHSMFQQGRTYTRIH
jgi:hypothetical protein